MVHKQREQQDDSRETALDSRAAREPRCTPLAELQPLDAALCRERPSKEELQVEMKGYACLRENFRDLQQIVHSYIHGVHSFSVHPTALVPKYSVRTEYGQGPASPSDTAVRYRHHVKASPTTSATREKEKAKRGDLSSHGALESAVEGRWELRATAAAPASLASFALAYIGVMGFIGSWSLHLRTQVRECAVDHGQMSKSLPAARELRQFVFLDRQGPILVRYQKHTMPLG
ncbi:uncharacterized protein GIQ15_00672 [Arthroderma uncinatum]|uniref:uncharacterized protein n=1 Tax=Arthroderma uncinatum TaxID=74035 RepID=UPI00144ADF31|nr:uncharacterized protein GIQ15_00672 [Arthroderma uncinatum]KAF3491155.1 hypothetical protein GIQ15_00672 [Arthroderma uncinatum]